MSNYNAVYSYFIAIVAICSYAVTEHRWAGIFSACVQVNCLEDNEDSDSLL